MSKDTKNIYLYKGSSYEYPPIKTYCIDKRVVKGSTTYLTLRRVIPMWVHIFIIMLLISPHVFIITKIITTESVQVRQHTMRIPSEMYYDYETKILDLDITNDSSNFEVVNITLLSSNNEQILELKGINPGDAIGSIPTEFIFDSLPMSCKIIYQTKYDDHIFNDTIKDVLIVDRSVADKDVNRDF